MTEKQQRRFFFPLWTQTCRKLGWHMKAGRLVMERESTNIHVAKVIAAGEVIALKHHRAMTLDDLRHGSYLAAISANKDTLKLNNREVDSITSLWKLMQEETNIAAAMRLEDPTIGARERLVIAINKLRVPDAMIISICRRSFAPVYNEPFHEDLPLPNLRALLGILTEMKAKEDQLL
jgi:hypothetical protein